MKKLLARLFGKKKPPCTHCRAKNKKGEPCKAHVSRYGDGLCFMHHWEEERINAEMQLW